MKMLSILFISLVIIISGCQKNSRPTGKIFERREVSDNKLVIKYVYTKDGQQFVDSATINNVVLKGDSINVNKLVNRLKKQRHQQDR